nr:MAG TPA: hypothetical protein [Bacteriophage sp.]DAP33015.1 MAG TPA: hypothetical protein [Caudoviricetes sp.]
MLSFLHYLVYSTIYKISSINIFPFKEMYQRLSRINSSFLIFYL